jgi:hypothetical protein
MSLMFAVPGWFTHHLELNDTADIDEEVSVGCESVEAAA